nr:ribosomal protein S3 [Hypnea brasiliensis]
MAQKINPISVRLGISQLWMVNSQFYGKSFKSYFVLLHYYLRSFSFLKIISNVEGFSINHQQWHINKLGNIKLYIYYIQSFFILHTNFITFYNKIQSTLNKLFKNKIQICFYLVSFPFLSKNLLYSYSQFLVSENLSPKKILWNFSILLKRYLHSTKLVYTPQGIKISRLKGFKIQISGRLDDSKTQMAKSLNLSVGRLCLTSLQDFVIYSTSILYNKSGTCGLKIWLFYEFQQ